MALDLSVPDGIGGRIRQLRLHRGLTQKAFAASLGIVQGFLSALETEKKIPSETLLIALCQLYHLRRDWLLWGRGDMSEAASIVDSARAESSGGILLLKRITPDFPNIAPEDIEGTIQFPELEPGCYAIRFEGDFMAPTITDGDLVVFQVGAAADNKDIVLVTNRWGDVILRRYRLRDGEVYLAAENASYSPFRPDPQTRTIGKVVAIWRKVKI